MRVVARRAADRAPSPRPPRKRWLGAELLSRESRLRAARKALSRTAGSGFLGFLPASANGKLKRSVRNRSWAKSSWRRVTRGSSRSPAPWAITTAIRAPVGHHSGKPMTAESESHPSKGSGSSIRTSLNFAVSFTSTSLFGGWLSHGLWECTTRAGLERGLGANRVGPMAL